MLHHERLTPPSYVYPPHEWKFIEKRFFPRFLAEMETIFSTSNGYLGMRGNFEEGEPSFQHGTYINGFYESWPIVYGETAFGFAQKGQTIVNVPDAKIIKLYVDGEVFSLPTARLLHFERALNMQNGTLERDILWETPTGKQISIRSQRLVSFEHRHMAAIRYEVTVLNAKAPVVISSEIVNHEMEDNGGEDPRRSRIFGRRALVPRGHGCENLRVQLSYTTLESGMSLACGIDHALDTENKEHREIACTEDEGRVVFSIDAEPGKTIRLLKYICYQTSRNSPPEELMRRARWCLNRAVDHGFDEILEDQRRYLDDFWDRSDVRVVADPEHAKATTEETQLAIRWNLFQLLQASARVDGIGIPAKGLTGSGYEGHTFWDVEIYVLPFLIYTAPHIARNLLRFRYSMLDEARRRAREVNQKGALFPWRTINGKEASSYYAAGTAQYHINADIMHALRNYVDITGDLELLHREGAEMLVETARLWCDLGFFSKRKGGKFCINGVTGPDEYNTVVDNNTFTNLMARENLRHAVETVTFLRDHAPGLYRELTDKTRLEPSEIEAWKKAAEHMYIPYDEDLQIHPQDDSFLDREPWDFENTPRDRYPLLLHHHPLVIYRHRVIKQADIVLAMFLLGHEFTEAQKRRNFQYYDPLTTGDSSLSVGIQSIMASEIRDADRALRYARYCVLMDLADIGGNVRDGVHIASAGASWMVLVHGFAGLRDFGGRLCFAPWLPPQLDQIRFKLRVRGCQLEVCITEDRAAYRLIEGHRLTIFHEQEEILLSADSPSVCRELAHIAKQDLPTDDA